MKNSLQLLGLGLVLFLGACSATEGDFLKKVENKTVTTVATDLNSKMGKFSADGKIFSDDGTDLVGAFKFDKASDDSSATYTATTAAPAMSKTFSIQTSDGTTGIYTLTAHTVDGKDQNIPATEKNKKIWLQVAPK